jgi:MoaA/NifB/PqqE/SkfB family radical SAM enzyme
MCMTPNRKMWRITLDTNPDHCNLNCIMCEDHSIYSRKNGRTIRPMMPESLMESIIRQAAQLGVREIIPSTMGEPILYNHFEKLVDFCRELNLKLNLTTNGTFPLKGEKDHVDYWGQKVIPIGSDIKISWNGSSKKTQEKIMVGTTLEAHMANARTLVSIRDSVAASHGYYCRLTLQLTFMEMNLNEIPDLIRMAIKLGFDRVKGHHLWAHFKEITHLSLRRHRDAIQRWNRCVSLCTDIAKVEKRPNGQSIKLEHFFPLSVEKPDDIAPGSECPFIGKEAWVDHAGRFNVCCAPDAKRRTLGDFGNLNTLTLADIWNGGPYIAFMESYMKHPLCKSCNMRTPGPIALS